MCTGETDITSTTSDELEAETSNIPIASNALDSASVALEQNEADFKDLVSSTPLKKRSSSLDAVDKPVEKRKRGRPRKSVEAKATIGAPKPAAVVKPVIDNTVQHIHNEVKLTSHVPTRHLRTNKSVGDGNSEFDKFLKRQLEFDKDLPIRKRSRLRCESTL